ncbi:MAG TPA: sigma-70 family RNA polymerase sigma factor [Blastocatellia bacterium]|nr:sigma-70 family RNA polymerase sigma factor [Blastocatellia bacterium]
MPDGSVAGAGTNKNSLESLGDEEVVDLFLASLKTDRESADMYFEAIIGRYYWLITHIVRNSHFKFPAWDTADDVVSRTIFKVYRGLSQWRRQGKLSSFIARITTSELIDTIRRVRRDQTWDPRPVASDQESDRPTAIDLASSREPSPEAQLVNRERQRIIGQLLDDVCRDWKDSVIVNEYIIAGSNGKEISEKYEMSEDLVYQRARRLRVRLMKWLAERDIHSPEELMGSGIGKK